MAGPKLADYLEIRERELESQISNVRGHLAPLEAELAQVRKIRSLIADARAAGLTDLASDAVLPDPPAGNFSKVDVVAESALRALQSINEPRSQLEVAAEQLTIKQMILRALRDHFDGGATPTELRDYMWSAFNKNVDRNSISPQLARLRDEGLVEQPPELLNEGKWRLVPLRGVSAADLVAIGHWPPGAEHRPMPADAAKASDHSMKDKEPDRGGRAAIMKPHQDDFLE
jgi:DNA-binding transcriptional ArsR family regulator